MKGIDRFWNSNDTRPPRFRIERRGGDPREIAGDEGRRHDDRRHLAIGAGRAVPAA
ncbi:hypothetical protein [Aurantimonas sp. 22II-16-19i]|uniref:hypothetical protein n=1 Tax=Aurantimonas sp. 22II-16-19i TaxID=1317114 RepID=UPI00159319F7|nr:hypothetical protein [Aurantimonas sp. 22II-16-19i]